MALVLHRSAVAAAATTCNPLPKWSTLDLVERRAFGTSVQPVPPNSIVIFSPHLFLLLLLFLLLGFSLPIIPLVLLLTRRSTIGLIYYFAV